MLVLAAVSPLSAAFVETHLNEITTPLADYTVARIAVLSGLPTPTKADKKELKALRALDKKLTKTAFSLRQDFAELIAAGATLDKLGLAAPAMQPATDAAVARAGLSLSERTELARDYLAVLTVPKHRNAVQKAIDAIAPKRAAAAAATKAAKRATALAKADAAVTAALKAADKFVLTDVGAGAIPPTRWRSGDSIGFGGGRIAVPRDANSPIAGASILIPVGLLQSTVNVTIEAAASFVGGKDLAAGPAVALGPDGLALGAGATLSIPYLVPNGATALDLALFAKGPPVTKIYPVTPGADGNLAANVSTFSTFQAGIAAPPPGQPGGTYHVQTFVLSTTLDPTGQGTATVQDIAAVVGGVLDQMVTFRPDHTASASVPGFPYVSRTFTRSNLFHHTDVAASFLPGSSDITWTSDGDGRFSFVLPLGSVPPASMLGVASADGRVIAWSGRGGTYEFLAVGVKTDVNTVTAQLAGRWAAVETGLELLDPSAEPFTTRRHSALRAFTVNATGGVTFESSGQRFETDVTYHSADADPLHTRAENALADGGTETWTIGIGGRLTDAAALRAGWFDPAAGLIVSTFYDSATRRVSLMVAVPQPATSTPAAIPGLYHWAGLEVGTTTGAPTLDSSAHDATPAAGSLDVTSVDEAVLSTDAATRAVYTLETATPTFLWKLSSASTALPAASVPVTFVLDAAGNHTAPGDEFWYAFAGDGRAVLRMTRGEPTRLARGIAIGVR